MRQVSSLDGFLCVFSGGVRHPVSLAGPGMTWQIAAAMGPHAESLRWSQASTTVRTVVVMFGRCPERQGVQ